MRGLFTLNVNPEISFLCLQYDELTYYNAKEFMLTAIMPNDNKFYNCNDYVFYENSNFIKLQPESKSCFPECFTMASYNDKKYTLIFIGLYSDTLAGPSCIEKNTLMILKTIGQIF